MKFLDILLIILSSAGLLHGVLFAIYLFIFKKKKRVSNYLLGLILFFMAFRIGKSIMLNFGNNLEPTFIFIGLALLLLIGPFFRWYMLVMTTPNFKLSKQYLVELVPFVFVFFASFFADKNLFNSNNKNAEFAVTGNKKYIVKINNYNSNLFSVSCTCPYDWGNLCKHGLAALYFLIDNEHLTKKFNVSSFL